MNRLRHRQILVVAAGMCACLIAACSTFVVYAASTGSTESITLSPVSKRYTLNTGTTTNDSFTISNTGNVAYNFIVYARPYAIINSDYNNPNYGAKANGVANADAYQWVKFPVTTYHLNPGESATVPYSLAVPSSAAPGGHYGVIFAETQASGGNASIARDKRVGMVVYATVNGTYKMGATIGKPTIPFFQLEPPLSAAINVQNTGNADFLADIQYRVTDIFGNQKYVAKNTYEVLPATTRAIGLQWGAAPAFGLFKVQIISTALNKVSNNTAYVFMAPYWFYGFVAIVIVGGVMYALVRRRR